LDRRFPNQRARGQMSALRATLLVVLCWIGEASGDDSAFCQVVDPVLQQVPSPTTCSCTTSTPDAGGTATCGYTMAAISFTTPISTLTIPATAFSIATDIDPCAAPMTASVKGTVENTYLSSTTSSSAFPVSGLPSGASITLDGDTATAQFAVSSAETQLPNIPVPIYSVGAVSITAPLEVTLSGATGSATIKVAIDLCLTSGTNSFCGAELPTCTGDQKGTTSSCFNLEVVPCICYTTGNTNWAQLAYNPPWKLFALTKSFDSACPAAPPPPAPASTGGLPPPPTGASTTASPIPDGCYSVASSAGSGPTDYSKGGTFFDISHTDLVERYVTLGDCTTVCVAPGTLTYHGDDLTITTSAPALAEGETDCTGASCPAVGGVATYTYTLNAAGVQLCSAGVCFQVDGSSSSWCELPGGPSAGAIVGAVFLTLAVLAAATAAVFFYRKKKRQGQTERPDIQLVAGGPKDRA